MRCGWVRLGLWSCDLWVLRSGRPVPYVWDPMKMKIDVTRNRLLELLARGSEDGDLDYKSGMAVEGRPDRLNAVSLAKDVAAFSDRGGWIVIGANDRGEVVGTDAKKGDSVSVMLR